MNKILIAFIAILLIAIGSFYFSNLSQRRHDDPGEIVAEEPYIIGEVHSVSENRILVAEDSKGKDYAGEITDLKGNAIWVSIEDKTEILDAKGNGFQAEDLKPGLKIEVWTKGFILESYPAQGIAHKIIVLAENGEELVKECFIGGCSGELCTDDLEAISTCELLPGMECIGEGMSCELVSNKCTWVLSKEAAQCFGRIESEYGEQVRNTRIGYIFEKAEEKIKDN